jgi:anthranilate phosphoribosyltransferase
MEMKDLLNYLFGGGILSSAVAKEILTRIGNGEFSEAETASFLTVFRMRKITPQELAGFREAMLGLCVPVNVDGMHTIDLCGTGGDGKNTFNISTLSSFVLAGAGVKVLKHGNYGASSVCGSSNIFEHYGYKLSNNNDKLLKELDKVNICYLHAPLFHPAMKHVGPVRKSLKVKTFFNILGPMINPGRPTSQIVGVFDEEAQELYHNVYKDLGINYHILNSLDGYDEISLTGKFRAMSLKEDKIYTSSDFGFNTNTPEQILGGNTIDEAALLFMDILEGKGTEAQVNTVLINSAFAISSYYPEKSIGEGIEIARKSLFDKKALQALKKLIEIQ